MPSSYYSRTNDAGSGQFFDRTNDADIGSAAAFGSLGIATTVAPGALATGYVTVTLVAPLYTGPGSILYSSNFTGTPAAGDTVRYPTNNGFAVLSDGSTQADTNSGAYDCFYTALDGSFIDFAFTVNLSGAALAIGDLATAVSTSIAATAIGFTAGNASGALVTVTSTAPAATAIENVVASGDLGTATTVTVDGSATSSSFPGDAFGSLAIATVTSPDGFAVGAAVALGALETVIVVALDGIGNEAGRGDAIGGIPGVYASTVDGNGRSQWGPVQKADTIWTPVPKHG